MARKCCKSADRSLLLLFRRSEENSEQASNSQNLTVAGRPEASSNEKKCLEIEMRLKKMLNIKSPSDCSAATGRDSRSGELPDINQNPSACSAATGRDSHSEELRHINRNASLDHLDEQSRTLALLYAGMRNGVPASYARVDDDIEQLYNGIFNDGPLSQSFF